MKPTKQLLFLLFISLLLLSTLQASTISGRVFFDKTHAPAKQVWIKVIPAEKSSNSLYKFTSTDEQGNYSINVQAGKYYVSCAYISNDGKKEFYYYEIFNNTSDITKAQVITVGENETVNNINFGLPIIKNINIVISGRVTDNHGTPLSNATITFFVKSSLDCVLSRLTSIRIPQATTNSEGKFEVGLNKTILSSIDFKLSAQKDGYIEQFYSNKSNWRDANFISISRDTTISDVNFSLNAYTKTGNEISGKVTEENGEPIQGILVLGQSVSSLTNETNLTKMDFPCAITDVNGNYKLDNLKAEEYIITFTGRYSEYVSEIYNNVYTYEQATRVDASGKVRGINASLDKYPSSYKVNTKMKNDANVIVGKIHDTNNQPLKEALVIVKDANDKLIGSAVSSKDGSYSIVVVGENISKVIATKPGFDTKVKAAIGNASVVDLTLNKTTMVEIERNSKNKLPHKFLLKQNYPNPFNPTTVISFNLPSTQNVRLEIFNVMGQKITTLINNKSMSAGNHRYEFNASKLNSGVYFYRLSTNSFVEIKKMMLLK